MLTMTILAILGVLLVVILAMMFRSPARPAIPAPAQSPQVSPPLEATPWDARPGDVVSIHGAAEDFSDLDFTIDRRSAYESNNRRWVDLSGEFRGRRVYLEVQGRAATEAMGILDGTKLSIADLGIAEQDLANFDSRQDPNASIQYDGKPWHYESSRELGYFENEGGAGEGLYRWLFREQNGDRWLCIEKWEGEPFDVRIARRLNSQDITVYRAA